jgi:2-keto-4-pentenoate hydratase/2-oxohepta-3-ene-1,7-dioic acid hydratase in catechol pathway
MLNGRLCSLDIPCTSLVDLLGRIDVLPSKIGAEVKAEVSILAPIPNPPKLFCLAGNYRAHLIENNMEEIEKHHTTPRVFLKPSTCIAGPNSDIVLPRISTEVDWEIELGVVLGARGRYIEVERAMDYVAGYVAFNDVSARSLTFSKQRRSRNWDEFFDWSNGKWIDGFGVMGPFFVTKDEIHDPHNLSLCLAVNGQLKQNGNTNEMIFSIPEIIAFISQLVTVEPGDVIATGTPAGVGLASRSFLNPGDIVTAEVEGLGRQVNRVCSEK